MKYKALMCDVDGTLIRNIQGATPTQKVIQAIDKAATILHVGIATSRPPFALAPILDFITLSGPSIVNAGAQIIEFPSNKILLEHVLEQKDLTYLLKLIFDLGYPFIVQDGKKDIIPEKGKEYSQILEIWIEQLPEKTVDAFLHRISHISTIYAHKVPGWKKNEFSIILTSAKATKQYGILEVAKILNISTKEVIGVGDGHNDFPLLMACGLKIAMGNAVDDLKAIADYIAPSVEEDGVADIIDKFILNA